MQPFFNTLSKWYGKKLTADDIKIFHPVINNFLTSIQTVSVIHSINQQSNSHEVFYRKVWQWMDGFMVLRMTHYIRDHGFPNQPILPAARSLLEADPQPGTQTLEEALEAFRKMDKPELGVS